MKNPLKSLLISTVVASALISTSVVAQAKAPAAVKESVASPDNALMLTVFLKHDQSRPLGELRAQLEKQDFFKTFPPAGVEIVSWNITMGIGHVIVLRLPASRLAAVNLALENTAWGPYKTEFFPSYDYREIFQAAQQKARESK